ncbi:purine-binding chemotaxis protein CheW [Undibacterium piscinae]|jgi:purine-binding chemotaxis protein CheW|uniref:Purine-binding chemotaxis protein CheW n=1 Tax=Undibacterium piscinae TaxID=2495591 RepID=A0A6M4A7E0_9BURK|nr:purine-binding chemotaxis protein CheW [Undibacterium piscinae]
MGAIATESKGGALVKNDARIPQESGQYLTFVLGGEVYALGILKIKEIIQYGDLTEVPMMPNFIRGVINLRGRVVPVVDLAARFGRGITSVSRRTSVVIIEMEQNEESEGQSIGIMVDAVNEVVDIAASEIEPPPSFGAKIRPDFISGMAKQTGRFIIVLNLDQVLSMEEMIALGQSMSGTSNSVTESENAS